tara:strand:+ start:101 stop:265 length:165 start_codon:yes stop_codon:yes gene_type:complete
MWSAVEEEIQRKKDMLLRQMVYDNVTYEEYLRISGEVRGLDFTLKLKSRRISGV